MGGSRRGGGPRPPCEAAVREAVAPVRPVRLRFPSVAFGRLCVVLAVALGVVRCRRPRGAIGLGGAALPLSPSGQEQARAAPRAAGARRARRAPAATHCARTFAARRAAGRRDDDRAVAGLRSSTASSSPGARPSTRSASWILLRASRRRGARAGRTSGRRSSTRGAGSLMCCIATATKFSPWNGTVAGQQLVEHDAERVDVACGRRPAGRSPARARCSSLVPSTVPGLRHAVLDVERARDPEVGHLRAAVAVQQHVLRLHVAVDEPVLVRERERRARSAMRELERLSHRQRPLARRRAASGSRRRCTRRR